MKKNDTFIGTCENYTYDGLGVVKQNGIPFFVKGILRGERGVIGITKLKQKYGYGRLVELLDASKQRRIPACPQARVCGGCQLQHMKYEEQLYFKRQKVQDVMQRIGGLSLEVNPVLGMEEPFFYRNKAQIPIGVRDQRLISGFYRLNSNDIIDMDSCCIQSHAINRIFSVVREELEQARELWDSMRHVLLKHAFANDEVMVVFICRRDESERLRPISERLMKRCPQVKSCVLNVNTRCDNVILGEEEVLLAGREVIGDAIDTLTFHISAKSFYQVNPVQTKVLYERALAFCGLSGTETVLDLYCGVGTISMFLAKRAKRVIGIEIVEQAIRNAKENAARNRIANVEFVCSDAAAYAKQVARTGMRPDVVCVDPPRKGCAQEVLEAIAAMGPKRVVYVSCDAATLARDLRVLGELGYETRQIQPVDMFPQTYHVETVALLQRRTM